LANQLALTSIEWNRVAEAVPLARVLTELYPSMAGAYVTYGLALALSGNTRRATAAYAKALQLDPQDTRGIEFQRRLGSDAALSRPQGVAGQIPPSRLSEDQAPQRLSLWGVFFVAARCCE